jgi:hypothetical protein
MEYTGGWEELVDFLLGSFGVPESLVGEVEDSSYSSLLATLKQFGWGREVRDG